MVDPLLSEIEAFCRENDVKVTTFGRRSVGDANLIPNLRQGRELRRATAESVRRFMREYRQPEQVAA